MPLDKQFHLETALVSLQAWAALITHKYLAAADVARRISKVLRDYAAALQLERNVPVHNDFQYRHIVVNGGLKVFDLDELRLGDPNLDLAHFCASLCLLAHRQNLEPALFVKLQSAFLDEYSHLTGWMPNKQFGYFYAYTCIKTAKQLCSARDFLLKKQNNAPKCN